MNDVMVSKIQSIHRCIKRAREEYTWAGDQFAQNFSRQDAAILNITCACEHTIDLANSLVKKQKLGIPMATRESFVLLATAHIIPQDLSQALQAMVGFRNIVIHEYQRVEVGIIQTVIHEGLDNILRFTDILVEKIEAGEMNATVV